MKFGRTLRSGMTGEDVAILKNKLMTLGVYDATITAFLKPDFFGSDTMKAVKRYQLANGLVPDGIVGILTWSELFSSSANPSRSSRGIHRSTDSGTRSKPRS